MTAIAPSGFATNVCDTIKTFELRQCLDEGYAIAHPTCDLAYAVCGLCNTMPFGQGQLSCYLSCQLLQHFCRIKTEEALNHVVACTVAALDDYELCQLNQTRGCT